VPAVRKASAAHETLRALREDYFRSCEPSYTDADSAIEQQVGDLDRKVLKLARHDVQVRRFMTTPGVGPITALCFKATIDDPTRFKRSRSVGAYVGLTTRRHASGEVGPLSPMPETWTIKQSSWRPASGSRSSAGGRSASFY
jgi:transposase